MQTSLKHRQQKIRDWLIRYSIIWTNTQNISIREKSYLNLDEITKFNRVGPDTGSPLQPRGRSGIFRVDTPPMHPCDYVCDSKWQLNYRKFAGPRYGWPLYLFWSAHHCYIQPASNCICVHRYVVILYVMKQKDVIYLNSLSVECSCIIPNAGLVGNFTRQGSCEWPCCQRSYSCKMKSKKWNVSTKIVGAWKRVLFSNPWEMMCIISSICWCRDKKIEKFSVGVEHTVNPMK